MTMAVGFLCSDGLVIGADRQITGANYTFPEEKIISFSWANGRAILAYSGERDTFMNLAREIGTQFLDNVTLTEIGARNLFKQCIDTTLHKKETFLVLFGFWIDGQDFPCLIVHNSARRLVDVMVSEVIGYGDSPLTRSLLGRFHNTSIRKVTVHQARIYAVDFISQAKKYDGQYVGDGIDVYSIVRRKDDGKIITLSLDPGQTQQWEKEIEHVHFWLDILFRHVIHEDRNPNVDQFAEKIRKFREWAVPDNDDFKPLF
jgi:hypothetical protein